MSEKNSRDAHFINMAQIIDNEFAGSYKVRVDYKVGSIRVYGHTEGGQCIKCDVKFTTIDGHLTGVYTQNEDTDTPGAYRKVTQPTDEKVRDYIRQNNFQLY